MNIWHDMNPKRITKDDFIAVIEIDKGSKCKYELDKETGLLRLDRILYTSTHYPANYGFIPRTYADDLDPLDVLVLCSETLFPMTTVRCYPIGVISMSHFNICKESFLCIMSVSKRNTIIKLNQKHNLILFEQSMQLFSCLNI
jgi:inorganic pyrophosphatase